MEFRRTKFPGSVAKQFQNRRADYLHPTGPQTRQHLKPLHQKRNRLVGQPYFTSNTSSCSAFSFERPTHVFLGHNKLIVCDELNNRVLIWNKIPEAMVPAPDLVLGQAVFGDSGPNRWTSQASANNLNYPGKILVSNGKLIAVDSLNNRVIIWNSLPSTNGQSADVALGQDDLLSNGSATTQKYLNSPWSVATDGTNLALGDLNNNRVLIWNTVPTVSGTNADFVVGQADFTSSMSTTTSARMNKPEGLSIYQGMLFVADTNNQRILRFNSVPTSNGAAADAVYGQADFSNGSANSGGETAEFTFNRPKDVSVSDCGMWIADCVNKRVMAYLNF